MNQHEINNDITIIGGDCLEVTKTMEPDSVDLVFGSPPYEDARTYGIDFTLKGQGWVDWMVEVVRESLRVCKGLVAFVVEGKTRKFRWSATPVLLMADLHRAGIHLRKPPNFYRVGIPGSGGPDWLRNDYEFIVCCTSGGELPWSDNTAMGKPCKHATGGELSYRNADGKRANNSRGYNSGKSTTKRHNNQARPEIANPGNVIHCKVGGGQMGSPLAHENEAPFPESLAEFFVKSYCPLGGVVLDPFGGSGTTAAVALKTGRNAITIDVRKLQCEIIERRIEEIRGKTALLDGCGTMEVGTGE